MRVGAVHDGDVPVGHALLGVDPRDFVRYPTGLLLRVVRRVPDDFVACAKCRPQFLGFAVLVFRDHRVRRVEYGLRRTVVLFEHDGFGVREVLFEVLDVADVGSTERVDGLVGVAHDGDPGWSDATCAARLRLGLLAGVDARELSDEHVLRVVGVLVFVHEDVAELVPVVFADLRAGLEQLDGAHDQIVEVDRVGHGQPVLVFGVYDGHQFVDVAGTDLISALSGLVVAIDRLELVLPCGQRVFAVGDLAEQHARRVPLHVDVEVSPDELDQAFAVGGVVDGEAGFESDLLAVAPKDAHACGMKGGDPHVFGLGPDESRETFAHFRRRLVGEGDGEDAARPEAVRQKPGDAAGEHACFTGSRPRADEQGLTVVLHRFHLLLIEVLDQILRVT